MESRYLLTLRYLGYGYRGWQKQPQVKTVQGTLERVLSFVTGHGRVRTLAAGRTDAGVSADAMPVMLVLDAPIEVNDVLAGLRAHLPQDIEALDLEPQPDTFSILEAVKWKEYRYRFAERPLHPFSAPYLAATSSPLEETPMREGATLFFGTHDFRAYGYKLPAETETVREILKSKLVVLAAGSIPFLASPVWEFRVRAQGFLRHQVRLMAGTLIALGEAELTPKALRDSLSKPTQTHHYHLAPASGLTLHKVELVLPKNG